MLIYKEQNEAIILWKCRKYAVSRTETLPGEITERYMRKLEGIIIKKPEDWLWSHRRWKSKITTFNSIII